MVKPNNQPATVFDLERAEKKWQVMLDEAKAESTSDATVFVYAILFKALIDKMGVTYEQLREIQKGVDDISTKLLEGDLFYEDIVSELEAHDVIITT